MTQDEFNASLARGAAKVESPAASDTPQPSTVSASSHAASSGTESAIDQYLSLLIALQSVQHWLTAAPTFIPQTFQDQIQFVFDGVNYSVYFYFNNQWNNIGTGSNTDASLSMSDITTNNVSISKHGFAPKAPNDSTLFLNGIGTYTKPSTTLATSFGGDGSDGNLIITSGTTTINLGGVPLFIKNYTAIEISGTGALTFSNPAAGGTQIIFRSQSSVLLTSSTSPCIELSGLGSAGGAAVNGSSGGTVGGNPGGAYGNWSYQGNLTAATGGNLFTGSVTGGGGGGASVNTSGSNGTGTPSSNGGIGGVHPLNTLTTTNVSFMFWPALPGGGGGGGGNSSSNASIAGTAGGNGGGSLMIECAAGFEFTGTVNANATNGGSTGSGGCAGGGGGAGGSLVVLYNTLIADSGTFNATGGTGGTGGATAGAGGAGAAGFSARAKNYVFS